MSASVAQGVLWLTLFVWLLGGLTLNVVSTVDARSRRRWTIVWGAGMVLLICSLWVADLFT